VERTVGAAAKQTGWSPRMLRYLEDAGLVVPSRRPSGYRVYGVREMNQLRSLRELRACFGVELSHLAFAARLRALGIPFRADLYRGGRHDWPYWQRDLKRALPVLLGSARSLDR